MVCKSRPYRLQGNLHKYGFGVNFPDTRTAHSTPLRLLMTKHSPNTFKHNHHHQQCQLDMESKYHPDAKYDVNCDKDNNKNDLS